MTVRVKFFSTLVQYTKSQQAEYEMAWRSGMTVQDIIDAEELSAADAEAIAAVVNLAQAQPDTELQDGDAVEFLVNLQGGSGVCVGLVSTGGLVALTPDPLDS